MSTSEPQTRPRLNLRVPTLIHQGGAGQHPEQVRAWLADLPKLNLGEFSRTLTEQLDHHNHCVLESASRHAIMSVFSEEAEPLIARFCSQCGQINFPLKAEKIQVYQQVDELLAELATGYKLLAMQLAETPHRLPPEEFERLHEALLRSLEFQSRRILIAYSIYRDPPEGLWWEIHHIYRYAASHEMVTPRVEHLADWSIGIAYLQMLLVGISNPSHLLQNEVHDLYARSRKWASAARLLHPEELDAPLESTLQTHFFVELDRDRAPRHGAGGLDGLGSSLRILDLRELCRLVGDRVKKLTLEKHLSYHEDLERDFLRRLRNAWSERQVRHEDRNPHCGQATVIAGLTPIHHHLSEQRDFAPEALEVQLHGARWDRSVGLSLVPMEQQGWREAETRRKLEEGVIKPRSYTFDYTANDEDVWKKASQLSVNTRSEIETSLNQRISHSVAPLQTLDESTRGVCLSCPADVRVNINVGSLLAIQQCRNTDSWCLATVRWMRTNPDLSLKLGARLITGSLRSVALRGIDGHGAGCDYQRCLILNDGDTDSYFVPAGLFHAGSIVLINDGQALRLLKFTRLVAMTKSYNRYVGEAVPMNEARREAVIESMYKLLDRHKAG